VHAPHGIGPASPRPQAARKSRGVQSTERLSPPICSQFPPITNTWAAGLAGARPAAGALRVRPAGYPQQLSRIAFQHGGELGDDFQSRIGRGPSPACSGRSPSIKPHFSCKVPLACRTSAGCQGRLRFLSRPQQLVLWSKRTFIHEYRTTL
jgi:hypothetical protein